VFKLSPSDRQLAAAAYAWMRRHWGERVCVLDDGTSKARHEAAAFRAVDPRARHASLGGSGIDRCVERADGVYVTALEGDPIFCTAATARRSPANALVQALALRGFDPASFAEAGKLWRAEPVPIRRTAEIDAVATRYHARAFVAATDQALRFYAATQIAARAAQAGGDPRAFLRSRSVATILGTVRFDDRGEVQAPAIVVSPAN
jgi:ABC-type branched-subunit amino acid transport system substrate-binding protein